jgi:hypothetical protein
MPFNLDQFLTGIDHLILFLDKRINELSPAKTKLDEFRRNCCKYLLTQLNRLRKVYKTAPMEEVARSFAGTFSNLF